MLKQRPTINEWLDLPNEQRAILTLRFAINKSGGVQVRNQKLVSDGVSDNDLNLGVNIGKMVEYLGEDEWKKYIDVKLEDLADTLWAACVAKEFGTAGPFEVKEEKVVEEVPLAKKATKKDLKTGKTPELHIDEPFAGETVVINDTEDDSEVKI